MRKIIERIVADNAAPGPYDLWIDTNTDEVYLKVNLGADRGGWKTIAGGSGSDEGGGGGSSTSVMMINGAVDGGEFYPSEGEPAFEDAVTTFTSGKSVILHISYTGDQGQREFYCPLLSYEIWGEDDPFFTFTSDGETMYWDASSDNSGGDDGPDEA